MKNQQWAQWLEVVASAAIIVTLIILVLEVRTNTAALQRQAELDQSSAYNSPFFDDSGLARVLAKMMEVDGPSRVQQAFMDRYSLTLEEAVKWERHLWQVWAGHQANFAALGDNWLLRSDVSGLLTNPDNAIYWENMRPFFRPEFVQYVERVRDESAGISIRNPIE